MQKIYKKTQFYLLFSFVVLIFIWSFVIFSKNNNNLERIHLVNSYFKNEISYLTTLNCSYSLNTLKEFIELTNLPVKIIQYWDSCNNQLIILEDYKEKMVIKENKVCLEEICYDLIKEKRNICIVYSLLGINFFYCF